MVTEIEKKSRVLIINRDIEKHIIPIIKENFHDPKRVSIVIDKYQEAKRNEIENCIKIIKKEDLELIFPCLMLHKTVDNDITLATYIGNSKYEGFLENEKRTKDNLKHRLDLIYEPRIRVMFIHEFTDNEESYCICHDYSLKMMAHDLQLFAYITKLSNIMLCLIKEICKKIEHIDINDYSEIDKIIDANIDKYCKDTFDPIIKIIYVILHFMVLYFYSLDNAVLRREDKLVNTIYGRIIDSLGFILMFEGKVTADDIASCKVLNNNRELADSMLKNIKFNKKDKRMNKIIIDHNIKIKNQQKGYNKDILSAWE